MNCFKAYNDITVQYMCVRLAKYTFCGHFMCILSTNNMKTVITMHGTSDCLKVNRVWSTYLSHPLCMIPNVLYSKIGLDNSWWFNTTNPLFRLLQIDWIWMWLVGGSHLVKFWATWSVGWKQTHVASDIRYILPAVHTYKFNTKYQL